MALPISLAAPPSRATAPDTFVVDMDYWWANVLPGLVADINGLTAEDWFSVQATLTDATAGKLMKVGAFGLGGSAIDLGAGDNLNDITASGFYYNPTAGNTAGNNYPEASAGSLIVVYDNGSRCVQYFTRYGDVEPRTYVRSMGGVGVWSAWREIYTSGSILGAVGQSGGVPTGAVIERGSNANGDYVRYADGSMRCTHSIDLGSILAVGSGTRSAPYLTATAAWTYPAAFASAPKLSGMVNVSSGSAYDRAITLVALGSNATGSGNINAYRLTDSAVDLNVTAQLTANGFWF